MSTRHPDPAVDAEMRRIVHERRSRPSPYGYDSPRREAARERPAGVDWAGLRRRCINITIAYVLIADMGLIRLAIREQRPIPLDPSAAVTTMLSPIGDHRAHDH